MKHSGLYPRRVLIALLALLLVAGAWFTIAPPLEWAEQRIIRMARQQGIPLRSLEVASLGWSGIRLRDITLETEPPLLIPHAQVKYDLALLTEQRAEEVEISGVSLPVIWKEGKPQAPWLDAFSSSARHDPAAPELPFLPGERLARVPFSRVILSDSRFLFENGDVNPLPLRIEFERQPQPLLRLMLEESSLSREALTLTTGQVVLTARWEGETGRWDLDLAAPALSVSHPAFTRLFSLAGKGHWNSERLEAEASLKDVAGRTELGGTYQLATRTLLHSYTLAMPSVRFEPGKFQPGDLSPFAGSAVTGVNGALRASAHGFSDERGEWKHEAMLHLEGLDGMVGPLPVTGVRGDIALRGMPPATQGTQRLTVDSVGLRSPLEKGVIDFTLKGDTLRIPQTTWQWLGGEVRAEKLRFALGDLPELETELVARNLSLESLLGLLEQGRLSASGALSGTIPVQWKDGKLSISAGQLTASGGHLSYPDAAQAVPGDGEQVALVREALRNLDYQVLRLTIGTLGGDDERVTLYVEGSNPDLMGGKPVHLTVNLTGDLMDTLRSSFQAYSSPEKLLESPDDATVTP